MASIKVNASLLRRAASTATHSTRPPGDISSIFPSLSGKKAGTLPQRFADLKLYYLEQNQNAIQKSWARLLPSLYEEVEMVKSKGSSVRTYVEELV